MDQSELPVSDGDLRSWVRQGQEAALDSRFDWEGHTLSLQDGFMRSAFRRIDAPRSLCMRYLLKRHDG